MPGTGEMPGIVPLVVFLTAVAVHRGHKGRTPMTALDVDDDRATRWP
jgi:hypothetical protein